MRLRVLTWNLFHGRAVPAAGRDLLGDFGAALENWDWDLALLQEVPPWWPAALARSLGCEARLQLTSRNLGLPVRRGLARRFPDLMRSGGGGANAILARSDRIVETRAQRLCLRPERRWVHGVRLAAGGWVATLHATAHDTAAARRDLARAAAAVRGWAGEDEPVVLGGDFNLRELAVPGLTVVASRDVDHILIGPGVSALAPARTLERGTLSDHVPLIVDLELDPAGGGP